MALFQEEDLASIFPEASRMIRVRGEVSWCASANTNEIANSVQARQALIRYPYLLKG